MIYLQEDRSNDDQIQTLEYAKDLYKYEPLNKGLQHVKNDEKKELFYNWLKHRSKFLPKINSISAKCDLKKRK